MCILTMVKKMKKLSTKNIEQKINHRITIYMSIVIGLFLIVTISLFRTIYINREEHLLAFEQIINKTIEGDSAPRGRIYDRNYKLLVDNEAMPTIVYKKQDKITPQQEIELAYKMSEYLDLDFQKLQTRNLKEFYLVTHEDEMNERITNEEREKVKRRILTVDDIYNLKITRITDEDLSAYGEFD